MVLNHMTQEYNLGTTFREQCVATLKVSREDNNDRDGQILSHRGRCDPSVSGNIVNETRNETAEHNITFYHTCLYIRPDKAVCEIICLLACLFLFI